MAGKLEFTARHGVAGRLGRAALSALRAYSTAQGVTHAAAEEMTEEVREAVQFYKEVLPSLPPKVFGLETGQRRPLIAYSDAMYEVGNMASGRLGMVVFDPEEGVWRHSDTPVRPAILRMFADREQYVGQLEVLAAVALYTTFWREVEFRGREVIHFIDNTGALYGLMKGYSRDVDSARLVHVFHTICAALGCKVWLAYVASKANIADLPSRGDFDLLLREYGSMRVAPALPPLELSWAGAFATVFKEFILRVGAAPRSVKRAKSRVLTRMATLRSVRQRLV